jgi:pimeloyl-ACP methyl ester carboxylesterase
MAHLYARKSLTVITTLFCSALLIAQPLVINAARQAESFGGHPATAIQQTRTSALVPIVFVPGTAGSELRLTNSSLHIDDELYWIGRPTLKKNRLKLGALDKCGNDTAGNSVSAAYPLTAVKGPIFPKPSPIYANFLSWARAVFGARLYLAPYDWRKGAGQESSDLLDKVVDRARQESGQDKVIILAHSLGGLVSRDYILRKGRNKVGALIAVGTPWLGTPKTVRALLWGYNFGAGKIIRSKGHTQVKDLPEGYTSSVCLGSRCQRLESVSLLKMEDARSLARNFPAVYQQLPTEEFMEEYGRESGELFRGVIWNKNTWEQMQKFYRDANSCLLDQTQLWRSNFLQGQDSGVKNYLIAGIYSPSCKEGKNEDCQIDNRMDMQMPELKQVTRSGFSKFISALMKVLNIPLSIGKYSAHSDPFVALDSDYQWGDGTSPLLSATAGENVRGDKPAVYPGRATRYLGPGTDVQTVTLGAKYGHSAMLDDPEVRKLILRFYKTESLKLGVDPIFAEDTAEVSSLKIQISAEVNGITNRIETTLAGHNAELTAVLIPNEAFEFKKLEIADSALLLPKDKRDSRPAAAIRMLLTSDIPNLTLNVKNITSHNSVGILKIRGIKIFVNGVLGFDSNTPFELSRGASRSFSLTKE